MRLRAFVDVDGVLADLVTALAAALGKDDLHRGNWPATYSLSDALGEPIDRIWGHPSVEGAEFWAKLPKLPWADALVDMLVRRFQGDVCFLTQPVRDPASLGGKKEWLREHYPDIPFLIGNQKRLVAAPGFVLVDDHLINAEDWRDGGGDAILIPAPWNPLRGSVPDDGIVAHVERRIGEIVDQRRACGW